MAIKARPIAKFFAESQGISLAFLATFAAVAALHFGSSLFIPIALSLYLAVVLQPLVAGLQRIFIPKWVGAILVVGGLLTVVGIGLVVMSQPVTEFMSRGIEVRTDLAAKLERLRAPIDAAANVGTEIENLASNGTGAEPEKVVVDQPTFLDKATVVAQNAALSLLVMLLLLIFLLARGDRIWHRIVSAIPSSKARETWAEVGSDLQKDVARYLLTIAVINAGLGLASGIALSLLGMPNPIFWGIFVFAMNFLPYVGALASLLAIAGTALLVFDNVWNIVLPPITFFVLTSLEGQFVTPSIVGRRLTLEPVAIVISLLFWGWLWGPVGMFLAVPFLAAFKILVHQTKGFYALEAAIADPETGDEEAAESMKDREPIDIDAPGSDVGPREIPAGWRLRPEA